MQNRLFRYIILEPQKNTKGIRDNGFGKFFDRHQERSQDRLQEEASRRRRIHARLSLRAPKSHRALLRMRAPQENPQSFRKASRPVGPVY